LCSLNNFITTSWQCHIDRKLVGTGSEKKSGNGQMIVKQLFIPAFIFSLLSFILYYQMVAAGIGATAPTGERGCGEADGSDLA